MRAYLLPFVLLLMFAGLAGLVTRSAHDHYQQAESSLAAARAATAENRRLLESVSQQVGVRRREVGPARMFLAAWQPVLGESARVETLISRQTELATAHNLATSNRETPTKVLPWQGVSTSVQTFSFAVSGSYPGTLRFLGALEQAFPAARIESLTFARAGSALSLGVTLVVVPDFSTFGTAP